jgi:hypothetical protein
MVSQMKASVRNLNTMPATGTASGSNPNGTNSSTSGNQTDSASYSNGQHAAANGEPELVRYKATVSSAADNI